MIQTISNHLQDYFINPEALIIALGLIAIVLFYLKKPQPQEQVMPSIEFFMKDKADGKLNKLFQRLKSNFLLILHILIFTSLVLAVAEPFELQQGEKDHRILILDNSANSHGELQKQKDYLKENTGELNTIITAADNQIKTEETSARQAQNQLSQIEISYEKPETIEAIRTAREYEGEIVIASNYGGQNIDQVQTELNGLNQEYQTLDPSFENNWGITRIEQTTPEEIRATVRNYNQQDEEIKIHNGDTNQELEVPAQSSNDITLELEEGMNTLELEEDQYELDNEINILYEPEERIAQYITNDPNEHVKTAIRVQSDFETVESREEKEEDESHLLVSEQRPIETDTPQVVLNLENELLGEEVTSEVSINNQDFSLGEITFREVEEDINGLTSPKDVLFMKEDETNVIYFNYEEGLEERPVYPLLWRETIDELLGTSENFYQSKEEDLEPGVHNGKAVNLLLDLESSTDELEAQSYSEINTIRNSYQVQLLLITIILVVIELIYLFKTGVLK